MGVFNIPYNPQTDPKRLFAQGLQNYLGGLNQQAESKRFGKAIDEVDPMAGVLQAIGQMMSGGATPQQAMGVGKMMPTPASPSQQISQHKLDRINMLQEKVRNKTATKNEEAALNKMLEGTPLVQFGKDWEAGILGPDAMADRVKKKHEDEMTGGKFFSESELYRVEEDMGKIIGESPKTDVKGRIRNVPLMRDLLKEYDKQKKLRGYEGLGREGKRQFDAAWDRQCAKIIGRPEKRIDNQGEQVIWGWDPEDERVQALRKAKTAEDMSKLSDAELNRIAEGG